MIELKHISKNYTDQMIALQNVSLKINDGEFVAIMEPSGAGKTTLMNIIGCIDNPTSGQYILDGQNIAGCSERKKARLRNEKFGFVVQDFGLISSLSVYQNVRIPLQYSKTGTKKSREKVYKILESLKISDKIDDNVNNLSGGQRQRVSIARALINSPQIILADEPTGALDSKTGAQVMDIFSKLNAHGKTIIIVTHDSNVASMCKRTIHMMDGEICTIPSYAGIENN